MLGNALTVDWTLDITGMATIVLAAVTLATVVVGGLALRQGQAELRVSRGEVQASQRPLLVPQSVSLASELRAGPESGLPDRNAQVEVQVANVGPGPALNISVRLELLAYDGSLIARSPRWWTANYPGIGAGPMQSHPLRVAVADLAQLPSFWLEVHYEDVAGIEWVTQGRHIVEPPPGTEPGLQRMEYLSATDQKRQHRQQLAEFRATAAEEAA